MAIGTVVQAPASSQVGIQERAGLLILVTLIALPHLWHMPWWVNALAALLIGWQAFGLIAHSPVPARILRAGLTLTVFAAVFMGFGRINGQQAGVALLVLMLALKQSEITGYRDIVVVLCLCCFVLVTQFLFSQSLWMAAYLIAGSWLVLAGFVHAHMPYARASYRQAAAESARMLALALPVAALFFLLFPRLPGPLWGLPAQDGRQATMGLSDQMSPGSMAALARSGAVAFRVRFPGRVPTPAERYWRGPVFWDFNAGTWHNAPTTAKLPTPAIDRASADITSDITLAPTHEHWLIALDLPLQANRRYHRSPAGTLLVDQAIDQRIRYVVRSATRYRLDRRLSRVARQRALALPGHHNPKARALAKHWASEGLSVPAVINRALSMFRTQPFRYTLNPPRTSRDNSVDDFLFSTRAGFCEHFAGAFTFLMRAAGVPARVVTGYQGAEPSAVGNYWIVRNSDAHAWSEVWLAGRGWVRVDPTAAVAPSRIEQGVTGSLADTGDLPFMARGERSNPWFQARLLWDAVNAGWNRWFLAYGPSLQQRLFAQLGLAGFGTAIAILTFGTVGLLGLVSLWLAWRMRPARIDDPVLRAWQRIGKRLAHLGLPRRVGEGPGDYAVRVAAARPDLATAMNSLARQFIALRYGMSAGGDARRLFVAAARHFRPRRRRTHS
ncbi:MAG: DUF3488 and transglutaminase-like domain-containing protein [Salinisphaera sp.]|jgi:transglutaminase-like putative cysteine protease|nr:DUF3488 and transglutaminase-like domain-containing protein [Salinisphaera sp.]